MTGTIVPLAEAHFHALGAPLPKQSVKGHAYLRGETVYLAFGWYPDEDRFVVFAQISDMLRQQGDAFGARRVFAEGLRVFRRMLEQLPRGAPVHALAAPQVAGSRTLLEHVGFECARGDVFVLKGIR